MDVLVLMASRSHGLLLSVLALLAILLPGRTLYDCMVDGDRQEICCCAVAEAPGGVNACAEMDIMAQDADQCDCCEKIQQPGPQQDLPQRLDFSPSTGLLFAVLPVLPEWALPAVAGEDFLPVQPQGPPVVHRLYIQYAILLI